MNDSHDTHRHSDAPDSQPIPPAPEVSEDAGAQALSEALKRSFNIVRVIMCGLVVLFLFSGFFFVGPQEKAILLRFGKPVGDGALYGPGSHWAFPPPIDEVIKLRVGELQNVSSDIGWHATAATAANPEPPPGESLYPGRDGYLITADENIIHVRATLQYRIAEPGLRFALELASATNAVRSALNNALVYAASRYKVDDILTRDQAGFREAIRARLEQLIRLQDLGITIDQIVSVEIIPPRQLKDAFARVLETEVRSAKELSDARTYENQTVSKARADAEAQKNASEAERKRLVEFVAAEVERFTNNLPAWRSNRALFVQRLQTETLQSIFTNAQEKIVTSDRKGPGRTLWIQINREPPKPKVLDLPKHGDH